MKKLFSVLITILILFTVSLSACNLPTGSDISGFIDSFTRSCSKNEGSNTIDLPITDECISEFDFSMKKKNGFYYPTCEGYLICPFLPTEVTVSCAGKTVQLETDISKTSDNFYKLTFNQEISYNILYPSEYKARILVKKNGVLYEMPKSATFVVDDKYTAFVGFDMGTGENISGMDKESNWIGPY